MDILITGVLALLAIIGATLFARKLGVAAQLLLVLLGIMVGLLPFVPDFDIDPEWILAGILPPLLYSTSVSMPAMDFRREFRTIAGLSVLLVIVSAVLLGLLFAALIPGLGLAWGIALGAIVSPTDAIATNFIKRANVSTRVVSILQGESLLNDASALVLLRSAIAGASATVGFLQVGGDFVWAVVVAVALGYAVGKLNLLVRARVRDSTVNTVISFAVPFVASIPAELLNASGLVAAVVAGLVTGRGAASRLPPLHRVSDASNWRTVELLLEGTIFLVMGLELSTIVDEVTRGDDGWDGIWFALAVAGLAFLGTIVVRAGFVAPLILLLHRRAQFVARLRPRLQSLQERIESGDISVLTAPQGRQGQLERSVLAPRSRGWRRRAEQQRRMTTEQRLRRARARIRRLSADIDFSIAEPLGWREGTVIVWAGMRGAVTLAAAQTLPESAPDRPLLILIAFFVAVGSLLVQGMSLPVVVRWLRPSSVSPAILEEERRRMTELMLETAGDVPPPVLPDPDPSMSAEERSRLEQEVETDYRLAVIDAQRQVVLEARDEGAFGSDLLGAVLILLDADQIGLEMKSGRLSEE